MNKVTLKLIEFTLIFSQQFLILILYIQITLHPKCEHKTILKIALRHIIRCLLKQSVRYLRFLNIMLSGSSFASVTFIRFDIRNRIALP